MAALTGRTAQVVAGLARFACAEDQDGHDALLASLGPLDHEDAILALRSATQAHSLLAAALASVGDTSVEETLEALALFAAKWGN